MEAAMTAIETTGVIDEISEADWLRAAAGNPAFLDLESPEEDLYTLEDGEPL
jgi:hypothetical protein